MKILSAEQMRAADQATFTRLNISSRTVMESAGRAVAELVLERFKEQAKKSVLVICGGGNNGGDGYVVARALKNIGLSVTVAAIKPQAELKDDALYNAQAWQNVGGETRLITATAELDPLLRSAHVLVDAIYGTGFKAPARGFGKDVIEFCEAQRREFKFPVVAVDLPSGLDADLSNTEGPVLCADVTAALQCLKPAHVCFPATESCGEIIQVDIGVESSLPEVKDVRYELVTASKVSKILGEHFSSEPNTHKGRRGHVLVIGGSRGKYGAPKMSARSALLSGAGLVTMVLPEEAAKSIGPKLTELMCDSLADDGTGVFSGRGLEKLSNALAGKDALVIGPGMGTGEGARELLHETLTLTRALKIPMVIDADALNLLAEHPELRKDLGELDIITPHPGEMSRLMGISTEEIQIQRSAVAAKCAALLGVTAVLKGARTVTASKDGALFVNPAAVETLATAGSGDVLAGVIAAFLARGMSVLEATQCAVFVHGVTGEILATKGSGMVGTTAGDIIENLPVAINKVLKSETEIRSFRRTILPGSLR